MLVVIAVDFSFNARIAIDCALNTFSKEDTKFIFLNAVYCKHYGATILENLEEKAVLFAQESLDDLQRSYEFKYPEKKIETAVTTGPVVPSICRYSEETNADILVIGSNGTSSIFEKIIGSTANGLIESSKTSLLIVPTISEIGPYNSILYSTDFKNVNNQECLQRLVFFINQFEATLEILHVKSKSDNERDKQFELDFLQNQDMEFNLSCIKKEAQVVEDQILIHAKSTNSQLIITCSHDYGFFTKLFHRSIIKALSEETSVPLLIVK